MAIYAVNLGYRLLSAGRIKHGFIENKGTNQVALGEGTSLYLVTGINSEFVQWKSSVFF